MKRIATSANRLGTERMREGEVPASARGLPALFSKTSHIAHARRRPGGDSARSIRGETT